jgi:uncharacterized membrane protein YfcA
MTPLLILLFGIHPATAVGTDLLYASATKTGGTLVHGWFRTVDWRVVGRLASGSVPATALTIIALSRLDMRRHAADQLITTVLGATLFATATALIFRRRFSRFIRRGWARSTPPHHRADRRGQRRLA